MSGSTTPTTVAYTDKTETYTVPLTGFYTITAYGVQGGTRGNDRSSAAPGSKSADIGGDIVLTQGEVLHVAVGGCRNDGVGKGRGDAGFAGGGTFVIRPGNTPVMIAGGGGASGSDTPVTNDGSVVLGRSEASTAGATRSRRCLPVCAFVAATAVSVLLALSAAPNPAHATDADAATLQPHLPFDQEPYTHPQRLVEVAPGRRLNLYCTGSGSPTVVMDAGFGNTALTWGFVQPVLATRLTRVCSYDRAGEAWSDSGPLPSTSSAIVADLHALLNASGESPPFVMVGHSFGGLNATLYAYLHPEDLAGLVLVDPSVAGQDARFAEIVPTAYEVNRESLTRFRGCADLARAGTLADPAYQEQKGCSLVGDPAALAPALREAMQSFQVRVSLWDTLASEFENLFATQPDVQPIDTREVDAARRGLGQWPLGVLPVVVLQASNVLPENAPFPTEVRRAAFRLRTELLDGLAAQSRRGVRVVVPNSGHDIQLEQPRAVIRAIELVVCVARAGTASSRR